MWDCTLTSPREGTHFGGLPISTSASPRKRSPGESCWATFADSTTPLEQQHSPVKEYSDRRDFKLVGGRLACKLCDDNVLRTVAGHDLHVRKMHDQLEVYSSYGGEESEAGGRVNPNVPKGRETHRAGLLRELKALGVTTKELAAEGYHLDELKKAGYTVKELRASGKWGLDELKGGGVTRHLKAAGATIKDLLGAGYSLAELKRAGFCCKVLRGSGDKARTLADLRAAGFSLHELREAGFGLKELKELKRPGSGHEPAFTLQDLKAEGFTCANLRRAGFALHDLKAGYTQDELKRSPCMYTHVHPHVYGMCIPRMQVHAGRAQDEQRHHQGGARGRRLLAAGARRRALLGPRAARRRLLERPAHRGGLHQGRHQHEVPMRYRRARRTDGGSRGQPATRAPRTGDAASRTRPLWLQAGSVARGGSGVAYGGLVGRQESALCRTAE